MEPLRPAGPGPWCALRGERGVGDLPVGETSRRQGCENEKADEKHKAAQGNFLMTETLGHRPGVEGVGDGSGLSPLQSDGTQALVRFLPSLLPFPARPCGEKRRAVSPAHCCEVRARLRPLAVSRRALEQLLSLPVVRAKGELPPEELLRLLRLLTVQAVVDLIHQVLDLHGLPLDLPARPF